MDGEARMTKGHVPRRLGALGTGAILDLHDRLIGRLDLRARERLLRAARERGWDRSWNDPVGVGG